MTAAAVFDTMNALAMVGAFVAFTLSSVLAWRRMLRDPKERGSVGVFLFTLGAVWFLLRVIGLAVDGAWAP